MTPRILLPFLVAFVATTSEAQFADGLNGSAFNGLWSLDRQPAAIGLSPFKAEVNLFHAMADVDNSYLQLERQRIGFMGFGNLLSTQGPEAGLGRIARQERSLDINARVMGPSVMFRVGTRTTVALTTAVRHSTRTMGMDALMDLFGGRVLSHEAGTLRTMDEATVRMSTLTWGEAGMHVARHVPMGARFDLHVGAAVKYLAGAAGGYLHNEAPVLDTRNEARPLLHDIHLDYGLSGLGIMNADQGMAGILQGAGWGADAGFILTWKPATRITGDGGAEDRKRRYFARLGLSITDMGSIRFGGEAMERSIRDGAVELSELEQVEAPGIGQLDATVNGLLSDQGTVQGTQGLVMALPTAMHANLDIQATGSLFLNLATTIGLDRGIQGAGIPANLSVTPRFGGRRVEVGVPVSLHQFEKLKVGLALRMGGFMVGSDKLGGLFGLSDLSGMDAYVGLKVNLGYR